MKKLSVKAKIIILAAVVVLLAVALCFTALASNSKIYNGVSVAGVYLGGLTVEEASEKLAQHTFFQDIPDFECEGRVFSAEASDFALECDREVTAQAASDFGKDENMFVRVKNAVVLMFNPADIHLSVKYDKDALSTIFEENIGDLRTPTVEMQFRLDGDKLYILNGNMGIDVNLEKLEEEFARVAKGDSGNIQLSIEPIEPTALSAQELYDMYCKEKINAAYEISDQRITYTESQDGIEFDVAQAEQILAENKDNTKEYFIPLTITKPDKTVADINDELFGDKLATYTSRYNPGEIGRTKNVTLAANKINNVVLGKDDIFSYNDTVGERTEERGFAGAKVYAGGEVVDGLGGGICQVSSTLYNAVLYADLEVVSRTCHSLPVAYVPLGRDATVSYGSIDFKFKNQYDTPVKITSSIGGGVLTVSIYGKKDGDKKVEIYTQNVSTTPFSEIKQTDETLPAGETKVKQAGSNGGVVNTFKKVTENGKVMYDKMIHTSRYSPINKIVLISPVAEEVPSQELEVLPETETQIPPQVDEGETLDIEMSTPEETGEEPANPQIIDEENMIEATE